MGKNHSLRCHVFMAHRGVVIRAALAEKLGLTVPGGNLVMDVGERFWFEVKKGWMEKEEVQVYQVIFSC